MIMIFIYKIACGREVFMLFFSTVNFDIWVVEN